MGGKDKSSNSILYYIIIGFSLTYLLYTLMVNRARSVECKKKLNECIDHVQGENGDMSELEIKWTNVASIDALMAITHRLDMLPNLFDGEKNGEACWYDKDLYDETGILKICVSDRVVDSNSPSVGAREFMTYTVKKYISNEHLVLLNSQLSDVSFWYDRSTSHLSVRSYRHGNNIALLYTILEFSDSEATSGEGLLSTLMAKIATTILPPATSPATSPGEKTLDDVHKNLDKMERYVKDSVIGQNSE
jgi:hypothetical protein